MDLAQNAEDRVDNQPPHVLVVGEGPLLQRVRTLLTNGSWASTTLLLSDASHIEPQLVITTGDRANDLFARYPSAAFLSISSEIESDHALTMDAADILSVDFTDADLKRKILSLLSRRGHLLLLLQDVDSSATRLAKTESCEWVRSRVAIVGITRLLKPEESAPTLRSQLARAVTGAHAILDSLPESIFTVNDAWNLLLLISLPWTDDEAIANQSLYDVLSTVERDLRGSRKILLWRGISPSHHLEKFGHQAANWVPSSPDPLREELRRVARDTVEAAALEVLFQSRITESDLEYLIDILAREQE